MNWSEAGVMEFLTPKGEVILNASRFQYGGCRLAMLRETTFLKVILDACLKFKGRVN